MKRRFLSILTALALCLSLCPTWAFAAESEIVPDDEVLADAPCPYGERADDCRICPIEDLIAALPEAVTEDNRAEVEAQLQEILDLFRELTEEEQGQIDLSLAYALQAELDAANEPAAVEEPEDEAAEPKTIYLKGSITSQDNGESGTRDDPVKTLRRALELAGEGGTIVVLSTIYIVPTSMDDTELTISNVTIECDPEFKDYYFFRVQGSMFYQNGSWVHVPITVTLENTIVDGNQDERSTGNSYLFKVDEYGELVLGENTVLQNSFIAVSTESRTTESPAVFRMEEGSVISNNVGAIELAKGTEFIMNGGTIADNSRPTNSGSAVIANNGGNITINGGEITRNSAYAGAIYNWAGTVTINSGKIYGNTGTSGGSIYNSNSGSNTATLIIRGGEFLDTDYYGSGLIYDVGGMIDISGGTFRGRGDSDSDFFSNGGTIKLSGSPVISSLGGYLIMPDITVASDFVTQDPIAVKFTWFSPTEGLKIATYEDGQPNPRDFYCTASGYTTIAKDSDVILTAGYLVTLYPVDENGDRGEPEYRIVQKNEKVVEPEMEVQPGDVLAWYTDEAFTEEFDFETPVTQDITLYARLWTCEHDGEKDCVSNGDGTHKATCAICGLFLGPKNPCTYDFKEGNTAACADCGSEISISVDSTPLTYNAAAQEPAVTVTVDENELSTGYTVTYSDNTNAGTASVTVEGTNFEGTYTQTFTIAPKTVTADSTNTTLSPAGYEFDGTDREPEVAITDDGRTIPDSEYAVSYSDNRNAGTATVTITDNEGGNYTVSGSVTFDIRRSSLENAVVTLSETEFTYDGTPKSPRVTVTKAGSTVAAGEYDISYANASGEDDRTNAGTVTVTVTAKADGNYSGSCSTTFVIKPAPLTIKANDQTIVFGQSIDNTAVTPTGLCGGDVLDSVTLAPSTDHVPGGTITPSAAVIKNASSEDVTGNYRITYASGSLTITPAPVTLTFSDQTITYGGTPTPATADPASAEITYSYVGTGTTTGSGTGWPTNAGTYTVTAEVKASGNYGAASATATLTITKADHGDISAETSCVYGQANTYDLASLLPEGCTLGTVTTSDSNGIFDGEITVSGTTLTYKLVNDAEKAGKTGTITVPVTSSTNYNAFDLTITVTVTDKAVPTLTVNPITVTYTGSPVPDSAISGIAAVGGQTISGTWSFVEGQNITNVDDSGLKQVRFTPDHTDLYRLNTGTVNVTIRKATLSLALTASPAALTNGGTVTLTLSGLPEGGSATVTCDHETISVTKGSGNTWTADLPAGGASYTFTASYAGDGNHNSASANCTVSVEKTTPTLSLSASPDSLIGGGMVTLTLTGLPAGGSATVACSGGISVTAGTDNTWTATLPNSTATYTFTASYAGNTSYNAASAACAVTVKEAVILPDPPADDGDTKFRLVMETEISEVPEGLKDVEGLNTPEELIAAMKLAITEANSGISLADTAVYNVELLVSTDGGLTWTPATKENFPSGGLVITLPYPDGTNSSCKFTVAHMFTSGDFGHSPGKTETPAVTNTADGIRFTVTGLSPISVGWERPGTPSTPSTPSIPSGPSVNNPGTGVSAYAITVEKPEHGKVTSNLTYADSDSTVTLTVTPDSGYVLDTLTVTDSRGNEINLTAQGGGRYTFTMPSRDVTVRATFAPLPEDMEQPCDGGTDCPSRGFTDLGTVGTWYHEAVDYVLRNGLMNGYSSAMFGPNDNLSRAQLAQILYNREGKPLVTGGSVFADAADGQWYTPAIIWAAANGIVGGYGNGLFGPDDNITREQLAVMLWRYAGSPAATDKELHFTDADQTSGYALEALRWAVENGIINGVGSGLLDPGGLATRAQVAQMLKNFLDGQ